jgi:hypothetical protein
VKCSAESKAIVTKDRFYFSFVSANVAHFFLLCFSFQRSKG